MCDIKPFYAHYKRIRTISSTFVWIRFEKRIRSYVRNLAALESFRIMLSIKENPKQLNHFVRTVKLYNFLIRDYPIHRGRLLMNTDHTTFAGLSRFWTTAVDVYDLPYNIRFENNKLCSDTRRLEHNVEQLSNGI